MINKAERQRVTKQFHDDAYNRLLSQSRTGNTATEAFDSGWNAALSFVGSLLETRGGDGCFCVHHPDDPAHTEECYSVLTMLFERAEQ